MTTKTVEHKGKTYTVHFNADGSPQCVVVHHNGKPFRNIGITGPVATSVLSALAA